jgi:hypothetical protein
MRRIREVIMNVQYDDVRTWFQLHRAREREKRLVAWLAAVISALSIETAVLVLLLVGKL